MSSSIGVRTAFTVNTVELRKQGKVDLISGLKTSISVQIATK
jgi:hypothetical protein